MKLLLILSLSAIGIVAAITIVCLILTRKSNRKNMKSDK